MYNAHSAESFLSGAPLATLTLQQAAGEMNESHSFPLPQMAVAHKRQDNMHIRYRTDWHMCCFTAIISRSAQSAACYVLDNSKVSVSRKASNSSRCAYKVKVVSDRILGVRGVVRCGDILQMQTEHVGVLERESWFSA